MRRHLITVGLCAALAGCGASTPAHSGQGSAHATTSGVPGAAFAKAKAAWKQSAAVSAANASRYLLAAADDLEAAGPSGSAAVRQLRDLASIPETSTTAEQRARAMADVAALDRFFGTPGLTPAG
jgi:hypothetical protein